MQALFRIHVLTIAQMAPHSMETILRPPQWPVALANFVTWCLMWDPRNRPTSAEAMRHEYFADAVDPLRPKSSSSNRLLGKKQSNIETNTSRESSENPAYSSRPSWFRRSLVRDPSPAVPVYPQQTQVAPVRPSPAHANTTNNLDTIAATPPTVKYRPFASKRATWTNGTSTNAAPMPILPSIRPISPFSDTVNAQAQNNTAQNAAAQAANANSTTDNKTSKKIGRQLSVHSNGSHYTDYHRQEAERALNGQRGLMSPTSEQKEGFFSHLRKRARRFSGKPTVPVSPTGDDIEANAGCAPWQSNRSSMILDSNMDSVLKKSLNDVDKALQSARTGAEPLSPSPEAPSSHKYQHELAGVHNGPDRHPPLSKSASSPSLESAGFTGANGAPISSRTRRALHRSTHPSHMYDTPDEEDELLHEALNSASTAAKRIDRQSKLEEQVYLRKLPRQPLQNSTNNVSAMNPYPTPSPSAKRNGMLFDQNIMAEPVSPLNISKQQPNQAPNSRFPTPPYEENEWAASAAASIFAAGSIYH